jgi:hypothetical protein
LGCGDFGGVYGIFRIWFGEAGRQVLERSFSAVMVGAVVVNALPSRDNKKQRVRSTRLGEQAREKKPQH